MNNSQMQQLLSLPISSPLFKRAQEMVAGKSGPEVEQIARNICDQKGINYDEAFTQFRQLMGYRS